jgi:hypothetical protein
VIPRLRRASIFAAVAALAVCAPALGDAAAVPFLVVAGLAFFGIRDGDWFETLALPGDREAERLYGLAAFALASGGLALFASIPRVPLPYEAFAAATLAVGGGRLGRELVNPHTADEFPLVAGYVTGGTAAALAGQLLVRLQAPPVAESVNAAGASGLGVFQAAQERGKFAIGVDADQSQTLPEFQDVIIGSAVKYIDEGTNEAARAAFEDDFDSIASEHNLLGLEEEAVDAVIGQAFEGSLPDAVGQNIDEAKQGIVDGDIDVPCEADGC